MCCVIITGETAPQRASLVSGGDGPCRLGGGSQAHRQESADDQGERRYTRYIQP